MSSFKLLWAIFGEDGTLENSQRGQTENATLEEAMRCIDDVLGQTALLEVVVIDPPREGPRGLQVRTHNGKSILTLAEIDEKMEKKIRTYRNGEAGGQVEMMGGKWKSEMICKDNEIVRKAVAELMTSMKVSNELLG